MVITFTYDIPNAKLTRLRDAIRNDTRVGYTFDPTSGLTAQQQELAFIRRLQINQWRDIVFNYERTVAINTPNDSAAAQAQRFGSDFTDEIPNS